MQLTNILSVALLAATASATQLHGRHQHLVRRHNSAYLNQTAAAVTSSSSTVDAASSSVSLVLSTGVTDPSSFPSVSAPLSTGVADPISVPLSTGVADPSTASDVELTTSTVYSTQLITVTQCAATVTNCPAHSTKTITSVVALYTTVCPVTAAGNSPSTATGAVTAASSSAALPAITGVPSNGTQPTGAAPSEVITKITNSTLTYTLGSGSSTTVVTTTIQHTSTETLYKTVYATRPQSGAGGNVGTATAAEASGPSSTTTISSTSTHTKYVTVYPVSGSNTGVAAQATGSAGANGECAAPTTVTVTAQETVYVTAGAKAVETGNADPKTSVSFQLPSSVLAPYPIANNTLAAPTGGSSGFLTRTQPGHPGSTGFKPTPYGQY